MGAGPDQIADQRPTRTRQRREVRPMLHLPFPLLLLPLEVMGPHEPARLRAAQLLDA